MHSRTRTRTHVFVFRFEAKVLGAGKVEVVHSDMAVPSCQVGGLDPSTEYTVAVDVLMGEPAASNRIPVLITSLEMPASVQQSAGPADVTQWADTRMWPAETPCDNHAVLTRSAEVSTLQRVESLSFGSGSSKLLLAPAGKLFFTFAGGEEPPSLPPCSDPTTTTTTTTTTAATTTTTTAATTTTATTGAVSTTKDGGAVTGGVTTRAPVTVTTVQSTTADVETGSSTTPATGTQASSNDDDDDGTASESDDDDDNGGGDVLVDVQIHVEQDLPAVRPRSVVFVSWVWGRGATSDTRPLLTVSHQQHGYTSLSVLHSALFGALAALLDGELNTEVFEGRQRVQLVSLEQAAEGGSNLALTITAPSLLKSAVICTIPVRRLLCRAVPHIPQPPPPTPPTRELIFSFLLPLCRCFACRPLCVGRHCSGRMGRGRSWQRRTCQGALCHSRCCRCRRVPAAVAATQGG